MIEELELLMQLQEIDLRIKEQEIAQEQYPVAVAQLREQIAKSQAVLDKAISKRDRAAHDLKNVQDQIHSATDMLARSQERLNSIKTNREYDAVHAEIESQKSILANAEHRLKTLEDEVTRLSSIVQDAQGGVESVSVENQPQISGLQAKIDAIDSNIAEITKERDRLLPKISKQFMRTYEQIRKKRKNGRALSYVSEARNCTVCYKVLEPQLYKEIQRGAKMILCQSCGSIFVWAPQPK